MQLVSLHNTDNKILLCRMEQVPRGSAGEVHVPLLYGSLTVIAESGNTVWSSIEIGESDGIFHKGDDGRFARFDTHSGSYVFVVTVAQQ